jgi:hypothetical protein
MDIFKAFVEGQIVLSVSFAGNFCGLQLPSDQKDADL